MILIVSEATRLEVINLYKLLLAVLCSQQVSSWTGIHLAQLEGLVLQCRAECLHKMEMVEGVRVSNILGNLFGYIQSCYFQSES